MGISRPTFSRLIDEARKKVAEALVNGKALKIETNIYSRSIGEPLNSRLPQKTLPSQWKNGKNSPE
ncbi:MAG: DUF134 domain-containing protein [Candidatus Nanoarchaeia archaeon]